MPGSKSDQLQIRVSPDQKGVLKRLARAAGQDLSSYVLSRVLPAAAERFVELVRVLERDDAQERRFALAELNDLLTGLAPAELTRAVGTPDLRSVPRIWQNYLAAMVELAAHQKEVAPPAWVRMVEPLSEPHFAATSSGLRLHLLRSTPVPFKRRNIFVDATLGDRV
jgi:uncharacterized protein (DUF1778 family)